MSLRTGSGDTPRAHTSAFGGVLVDFFVPEKKVLFEPSKVEGHYKTQASAQNREIWAQSVYSLTRCRVPRLRPHPRTPVGVEPQKFANNNKAQDKQGSVVTEIYFNIYLGDSTGADCLFFSLIHSRYL